MTTGGALRKTSERDRPTQEEDEMKLITKELESRLPALYSTQNDEDPVVQAKLFTPDSNWTWYLTEYDPTERLAFGLVDGFEREWGYFSIAELETAKGPLGLAIERDLYFEPRPASEVGRWCR